MEPEPTKASFSEVTHPAPTYGEPKQTVPTIIGTFITDSMTMTSEDVIYGCERIPLLLATNN